MNRMSVVELRQALSDVLNCAEYRGERVVIHRRGRDAAAIIPIEDLRLLERLIREEEDRIDIARSDEALADPDRIPLSALREELGMAVDERRESAQGAVSHRGGSPRHQGAGSPARKGS